MENFTYELTAKDHKTIKSVQSHPVVVYLKHAQGQKFKVGDYLIRHKMNTWGERKYKLVTVSSKVKIPKKYVVVHIDDIGMPYIKSISSITNKPSPGAMVCLANVMSQDKFELDPEYAESIILGTEYVPYAGAVDARKEHKENIKYNNTIFESVVNIHDFKELFDGLSVGDTFWSRYLYSNGIGDIKKHKIVEKKTFKTRDTYRDWLRKKNYWYLHNQITPPTGNIYVLVDEEDEVLPHFKIMNDRLISKVPPKGLDDYDND